MTRMNFRLGAPPLSGADYREVAQLARPGDLILTRTAHRPTNLLIPGKWGHVQILHGYPLGTTTEATWPVVRISSLVDVWTRASEVMLIRPKWATARQAAAAAGHAQKYLGLPYDTMFEMSERAFYCSELAMRVYADAGTDVPWEDIYTRIAGRDAVVPSSLDNPEHFEILWHGGKVK